MHVADETVLVVRDNRGVELLVEDDVDDLEVALLLARSVLTHARRHARGLSDVRGIPVCQNVHHRPVEDLVLGQIKNREVYLLAEAKRASVDDER